MKQNVTFTALLNFLLFQDFNNAKLNYEKSLSEFRSPETKTLLSEIESLLREEQRKAYINPEIAEQEKEKGNEFFRKGN